MVLPLGLAFFTLGVALYVIGCRRLDEAKAVHKECRRVQAVSVRINQETRAIHDKFDKFREERDQ